MMCTLIHFLILQKNLKQDTVEAGYRVQVATTPEFPQIGEPSQFKVKVTKGFDYEEVDKFTMGIRVYYNDQLIDTIPPKSIELYMEKFRNPYCKG